MNGRKTSKSWFTLRVLFAVLVVLLFFVAMSISEPLPSRSLAGTPTLASTPTMDYTVSTRASSIVTPLPVINANGTPRPVQDPHHTDGLIFGAGALVLIILISTVSAVTRKK